MPSIEREPLSRRRSNEELLAHIYREGERQRRRRRLQFRGLGALAGVVALAAGTAVAVRLPDGGTPQQVAARGNAAPATPGPSTSALAPPTAEGSPDRAVTTAPSVPPTTAALPRPTAVRTAPGAAAGGAASGSGAAATVDTEPEETTPPTTAAVTAQSANPNVIPGPAALSTTDPPECRNSTDSACGPFRWDPEPDPNAPLTVKVTATPRAGDPRTFDFTVVFTDPDAPIREGCRSADFGDGGTAAASGCAVAACVATYGPWTPPAKEPGSAETTTSHTFPAAGTYTVRFSASSGGLCGHPYASTGSGSTEVVVP